MLLFSIKSFLKLKKNKKMITSFLNLTKTINNYKLQVFKTISLVLTRPRSFGYSIHTIFKKFKTIFFCHYVQQIIVYIALTSRRSFKNILDHFESKSSCISRRQNRPGVTTRVRDSAAAVNHCYTNSMLC